MNHFDIVVKLQSYEARNLFQKVMVNVALSWWGVTKPKRLKVNKESYRRQVKK